MKHLISLLLILFVHIAPSIAYDNLNFRTIDIESGLSDNLIQNITQDKYGFMWFGTNNGVNRYDGYNIRHYQTPDSLVYSNNILRIDEDWNGNLWIKTPLISIIITIVQQIS